MEFISWLPVGFFSCSIFPQILYTLAVIAALAGLLQIFIPLCIKKLECIVVMMYVASDQGKAINSLSPDAVQQYTNCYKPGLHRVSHYSQGRERLEGDRSKNIGT